MNALVTDEESAPNPATAVLTEAWEAVKASKVPEALHETAFRLAVDLLRTAVSGSSEAPKAMTRQTGPGAETPQPVASGPSGEGDVTGAEDLQSLSHNPDEVWDKFSDEAEVNRETLEELFYFEGRTIHINVKAYKLATTKPAQMKAVAFALTMAYDYALDVQPLDTAVVRAECKKIKCLDAKNFGTYMGAIDGLTTSGSGPRRVLKAKSGARAAFKTWVTEQTAGGTGDSA